MAPRSDFWDRFVSVGHVGYFWRFRRGPNFAASRGVELLAVSHVSPQVFCQGAEFYNYSTIIQQIFNKYSTFIQQSINNPAPPRRLFNKYSTIIQHVFNMYSTCINSCPKSVIDSYSTKFNKIQHVFNKIQHVFNKIQLLLTVTNFIFTKKSDS